MTSEQINEKTHTVSEWVEWKGGECPVPPRTLVQVQCEFESFKDEDQAPRFAKAWDWQYDDICDGVMNIVAYRVVEVAK